MTSKPKPIRSVTQPVEQGPSQRQTTPFDRPRPTWTPTPAPRPGWWQRNMAWIIGGLIVACGAVAALALGGLILYFSDLLAPGVESMGVELGGKSKTQAVIALRYAWQQKSIIITDGQTTWTVSPEMLGLNFDAQATVQRAYRRGRSPAALAQTLQDGRPISVAPVWSFDPLIAETNLAALAPKFETAAQDATYRIAAGRAEAIPSQTGRALDVAATLTRLNQNSTQVLLDGRLQVILVPVPPAVSDAQPAVNQANDLLANSLTIRAFDPIKNERRTWVVEPAIWSSWLQPEPTVGDHFVWSLDESRTMTALSAWALSLGPDRYLDLMVDVPAIRQAIETRSWTASVRIYHRERRHTVRAGETLSSIAFDYGIPYPWLQQANPGLSDSLFVGQVITIPSPDTLLPLPVVENKRIKVSLSEQHMWAYENEQLIWDWPVSTGIDSSPTAPGVFQTQTYHDNAYASNWDLWMPHFIGIYRPVPTSDFMNGFHGFPTRNGHNLLWTDDLGRRVTYGCILVSSENAVQLYNWTEPGVIVEVIP